MEMDASLRPLWVGLRALNASLQRTLDEFRGGFSRTSIDRKDIPDARLRLEQLLKLTEGAAHHTLDLIERSAPLAPRVDGEAARLIGSLREARAVYRSSAAHDLLQRMEEVLCNTQRGNDSLGANLEEVLMAQSYQDLSGRIIRTVIKLVVELERALSHFSELEREPRGHAGDIRANHGSH